jgi:alkanesulfonate monooxygenase SsuD/methylene tetrahydromethanopterin reductase-like flavin-dependent oxidoreductase (luciferase family)
VLDALDVLAYVAASTNNIALGTHVEDMFFFTPVILAKRFITLDILSQGRVISGLGLGCLKMSIKLLIFRFRIGEKEQM